MKDKKNMLWLPILQIIFGRSKSKKVNKKVDEVDEMVYANIYVMEMCIELGELFIKNFNKLWHGVTDERKEYHLSNMQKCYDKARGYKLAHNNKLVSMKRLFDWFFMADATDTTELFDNKKEAHIYMKFVHSILDENMTIKDAWKRVHKQKEV